MLLFGSGENLDAAKGTERGAGRFGFVACRNPQGTIVKREFVISIVLDMPADFQACGEKQRLRASGKLRPALLAW